MFISNCYAPTIVGGSIVGANLILYAMNIKEKFGQKVKILREEKGLSIENLANISNVVSIEIIEKIINGLESDFETFFNDKGFKK